MDYNSQRAPRALLAAGGGAERGWAVGALRWLRGGAEVAPPVPKFSRVGAVLPCPGARPQQSQQPQSVPIKCPSKLGSITAPRG